MKMNKSVKKSTPVFTHQGGRATKSNDRSLDLYRTVCAAMLGEDTFYESGQSVMTRLAELAGQVDFIDLCGIVRHAKDAMKIRHAPLWVLVNALNGLSVEDKALYRSTLTDLITRPDELAEVLAMVWKDGKRPIPNAIRKSLADAFHKFNAYQFAKFDHNTSTIRLRDVMFLTHPEPKSVEEAGLFKQIANNALPTPDTWEVAISAATTADEKRLVWERLLRENKLGALALLRNLRNMSQVNVDRSLITNALLTMDTSRVLPFRFAAAARNSDSFKSVLDKAFTDSCRSLPALTGRTLVLVDHSGSMRDRLSAKSDMTRATAAQSLAAVLQEVCADNVVVGYHDRAFQPATPIRGLALLNWFASQSMHGTRTTESLLQSLQYHGKFDRIVIITDEQSNSWRPLPMVPETPHKYVLNVGSYKPSISNGNWLNITGFSEQIVHYIKAVEEPSWS